GPGSTSVPVAGRAHAPDVLWSVRGGTRCPRKLQTNFTVPVDGGGTITLRSLNNLRLFPSPFVFPARRKEYPLMSPTRHSRRVTPRAGLAVAGSLALLATGALVGASQFTSAG